MNTYIYQYYYNDVPTDIEMIVEADSLEDADRELVRRADEMKLKMTVNNFRIVTMAYSSEYCFNYCLSA